MLQQKFYFLTNNGKYFELVHTLLPKLYLIVTESLFIQNRDVGWKLTLKYF